MILWTVMPLELVFEQKEIEIPYEELDYEGAKLLVERFSPTECRIIRVVSSEPSHYLRPDMQPGAVLIYKPVFS